MVGLAANRHISHTEQNVGVAIAQPPNSSLIMSGEGRHDPSSGDLGRLVYVPFAAVRFACPTTTRGPEAQTAMAAKMDRDGDCCGRRRGRRADGFAGPRNGTSRPQLAILVSQEYV